MTCFRCGEPDALIMSMFNTDMICMDCKEKEKERPDYDKAEAQDLREYAGRLRGHGMIGSAQSVEKVAFRLEGSEFCPHCHPPGGFSEDPCSRHGGV